MSSTTSTEFELSRRKTTSPRMTYARSRLLLGMSGVGLVVVVSVLMLTTQMPTQLLPTSREWSVGDVQTLMAMLGCLMAAHFPLDLIGGYLLPNRRQPNTVGFGQFLRSLCRGLAVQGLLLVTLSLSILSMGRAFGLPGAIVVCAVAAFCLVALQLQVAKLVGGLSTRVNAGFSQKNLGSDIDQDANLSDAADSRAADSRATDSQATDSQATAVQAMELVSQWGWKPRPITVVEHRDAGFTGGVVGLPGFETIVLPSDSLINLTPEQVAVMIVRRLEAIRGGSRTRGLLLAFVWVLVGFALSSLLPGAGVMSVAQLATTCFGFTLWTFFGLLTLPTLSRQASYAIDEKVLQQGAPLKALQGALKTLDTLQDDEPKRPALIEAIFHPVPSVNNRGAGGRNTSPIAWHAARITLFVSWACMGMLVRAVHCNVGRPELWVMLPTD